MNPDEPRTWWEDKKRDARFSLLQPADSIHVQLGFHPQFVSEERHLMKLHTFWAAVGTALAVLAPAIAVVAVPSVQAQTFSVLYSFRGMPGTFPEAGLVRGKNGWLYGTTSGGGGHHSSGVVFRLTANGKEKVLHRFSGADGRDPVTELVRDNVGTLYGTTREGGAGVNCNGLGCGVVFKLDTTGAYTVLYSFTGGADGSLPGPVIRDSAGNLYGTTSEGGAYGYGVVFKLDTTGAYTVLYSSTGGADGAVPRRVIRDSVGNLYGIACCDGAYDHGVVFELKANGKYKLLHSFNGADGAGPNGLLRDSAGTLYGTTSEGGASGNCNGGCGVVFKLDTTGAYAVLYTFTGGADGDGEDPNAGLVRDSAGNLYGTTFYGGACGPGVVFKLDKTGAETLLHSFCGEPDDGSFPGAGLVRDSAGTLYGTTSQGGAYGVGVVFKITAQ
jgi:uncharacterized repeat protein (TIGR03803 family)